MAKEAGDIDALIEVLRGVVGDAFEKRQVHDDVLSALSRLEASKNLFVTYSSDIKERVSYLRRLGLHFAYDFLVSYFGADQSEEAANSWFEVSRIMDGDMPWLAAQAEEHTETQASTCLVLSWTSSVVLLAMGLRSSEFDPIMLCKSLARRASCYTLRVGGAEVNINTIEQSQRRLLKTLDATPSVATWLNLYIARLYECFESNHDGKKVLSRELNIEAFRFGRMIVLSPLHFELSQKQIAVGCLVLTLVCADVLPPNFFTRGVSDTPHLMVQRATVRMILKERIEDIEAYAVSTYQALKVACPSIASKCGCLQSCKTT